MRYGRIESPDPSDAPDEPDGGVDLVQGITGSFVDEDGSECGVSSESEVADAHRSVMGEIDKCRVALVYIRPDAKPGWYHL